MFDNTALDERTAVQARVQRRNKAEARKAFQRELALRNPKRKGPLREF
jgi:hypothetical protein